MSKISPFIRCESGASELAKKYLAIFPGSKICEENQFVTTIEIFGQTIGLLNGGIHPSGTRNPSISFSLWIKDQTLAKQIRDQLSLGGAVLMERGAYDRSPGYGRCSDSHGVSWQVMYDNCEDPGHENNQLISSLTYVGVNAGKAQEAMTLYTSLFSQSKIDFTRPYGQNTMGEDPTHLYHAEFKLAGQQFIAMDSGQNHQFMFNDGISLMVQCDGQEEVDHYRNKLITDGGQESQCGWCKDKYGVSRQIIPLQLQQAISNTNPTIAQHAIHAMMKMKKIIISDL